MTTAEPIPTTTWGDCPNNDCPYYGVMQYGIEPGDLCEDVHSETTSQQRGPGCDSPIRWWDRWHDGKHGFRRDPDACRGWDGE